MNFLRLDLAMFCVRTRLNLTVGYRLENGLSDIYKVQNYDLELKELPSAVDFTD